MFKGLKKDQPEFTTITLEPRVKCIKCGKPIRWGDFAYDQNMCWKCFETEVVRIAKTAETIEDTKIVLYLLKSMEEIFKRNLGGIRNE